MVLRGTGRIVARTRELEGFKQQVRDLAARADTSLGGAATEIDAVRRKQVGPETITETVAALERAHRALEMVEHGTSILGAARRGSRELEAQTSIKRGYLNLLHAREALARHALEAQALEPEQPAQRTGRRVA